MPAINKTLHPDAVIHAAIYARVSREEEEDDKPIDSVTYKLNEFLEVMARENATKSIAGKSASSFSAVRVAVEAKKTAPATSEVTQNMAGAETPYDHLPFFYSDQFELGYEAVGDVDSRLDQVAEWAEPNRKGVVGYVDGDGRARGFLLWDVWGKVDSARELIRSGSVVDSGVLRSLLD